MKKIFSTESIHPRERFDYWHSVACKNIVGHSSTPACRQTFAAEIATGASADISLVSFSNSPMDVARSMKHIAESQSDEFFVCRQVYGSLALRQDGRELTLGAGDVALLHPLLPYDAVFSTDSRLLVAKVHRRELEARIGPSRDVIAIALRPTDPTNRWMSSFLAMLPSIEGRSTVAAEELTSIQAIDLIATCLLKARGVLTPKLSSSRSVVLLKLRAAIEARLTDPDLKAPAIAEVAGVSVRYANALLTEENTSIMRLAWARRLARCRQALEDAQQDDRTVSEIARGWGFTDMTHFGRSFKAAYGVLPSECRRSAKK
jgi:AraC-like DNA-binding protein